MDSGDDNETANCPNVTEEDNICEYVNVRTSRTPTPYKLSTGAIKLTPIQERSSSLPTNRTSHSNQDLSKRGFSLDNKWRSVWVQTKSSKNESYKYGWWCFTPSSLQRIFNNAKAFVILVTLANVLQGVIVNGLLKVNVTSIERRYKLLSSESGLVISSYDIAGCLCLLPMSYIGGRGHKPRWISFGVLMMGLGSFILAMPRFLAGPYEYARPISFLDDAEETSIGLCQNNMNGTIGDIGNDPCNGSQFRPNAYLKQMKYVFMLGQFFNGIGNTPLSVLAVTFVDESVDKRVYPIYIGIYYMGALLGPAIGFVLGGRLLTTFTNLGEIPNDITPESTQWVGAWWVGFIIAGALTVFLSIPLFGYPRKLGQYSKGKKNGGCCYKRWWRRRRQDSDRTDNFNGHGKYYAKNDRDLGLQEAEVQPMVAQNNHNGADHSSPARTNSGTLLKNFANDILAVVSNRAFMFLSLTAAIYSTLVSGFSTFGPKFIESQLGKSAADAANLFGYVCIPAGAGGMLIGAFLMTGLKMNHRSALQMCIAVSLSGLLAHFVLVLNCEDLDLAGVTVPYNFHDVGVTEASYDGLNITSTCNKNCACPANMHFNPMCGNNITYFSPCHAGCSVIESQEAKIFSNCSCVTGNVNSEQAYVRPGICPKTCQWQTLILFSLFVVILTTFVCTVPGVDLSLRCFPYNQRSLAVGVQWVLIRTLGSIPGPIIFGAMIDGTCMLWGEATCDSEKGSCLLYKNSELSSSFLVLSVIYKAAGIIALILALFYIERDTTDPPTNVQSTKKIVELPISSNESNPQSTSGLNTASC